MGHQRKSDYLSCLPDAVELLLLSMSVVGASTAGQTTTRGGVGREICDDTNAIALTADRFACKRLTTRRVNDVPEMESGAGFTGARGGRTGRSPHPFTDTIICADALLPLLSVTVAVRV